MLGTLPTDALERTHRLRPPFLFPADAFRIGIGNETKHNETTARLHRSLPFPHMPLHSPAHTLGKEWFIDGSYRGISLIRNCAPLGPCSRPMPRDLWRS